VLLSNLMLTQAAYDVVVGAGGAGSARSGQSGVASGFGTISTAAGGGGKYFKKQCVLSSIFCIDLLIIILFKGIANINNYDQYYEES
jgi:hypothetical protein